MYKKYSGKGQLFLHAIGHGQWVTAIVGDWLVCTHTHDVDTFLLSSISSSPSMMSPIELHILAVANVLLPELRLLEIGPLAAA